MLSEQPEFPIQPKLGKALRLFLYSQLFIRPPYPMHSFAQQTVIVTGSNTGLGKEAARHFYRLNAARLILAVRSISKGQAAKEDIVASVKSRSDANAIEVWPLDVFSTESTMAFAERVKSQLDRVDVLLENAGINNGAWVKYEGYEQTVQVNVLNTFLLAFALLLKLNETKTSFLDSQPHLAIVSSETHRFTSFHEINASDLYAKMNDEKSFSQQPRYNATKLLEVLITRELVSRLQTTTKSTVPPVIINMVNPGLCTSNLNQNSPLTSSLLYKVFRWTLDRKIEVGSRTLVLAASAPSSSHAEFQSDGANQDVEGWIYSEVGRKAQKKACEQTVRILEARKPGIAKAAGL